MVQYTTAPKSSRGNRLGRGSSSTSTMEQYGYSQPAANITVSPSFSNIGNPNVSVGNIGGGESPSVTPPPVTPPPVTPPPVTPPPVTSPTTRRRTAYKPPLRTAPRITSAGAPVPPATGGGVGETRGDTLLRALKAAQIAGHHKKPRVDRDEMKAIVQQTGAGPREIKNVVKENKIKTGGRAVKFLNNQLKATAKAKAQAAKKKK